MIDKRPDGLQQARNDRRPDREHHGRPPTSITDEDLGNYGDETGLRWGITPPPTTIDIDSIPRCSERELADPNCPIGAFDPDQPIRWVRGTSLISGEKTWVPAVMASYRLRDLSRAERFWYCISTGYAVHTDPAEALVSAISEVAERDVVAVTWLQRIPWPSIPSAVHSASLDLLLEWSSRHFIDTYLLDATTDLGIPTVYCLQVARFDEFMHQSVGCATGRTLTAAAEKALLETMRFRFPDMHTAEQPKEYREFSDVADGAVYMGQPSMFPQFAHVIDGAARRSEAEVAGLPEDPTAALSTLVNNLANRGMQAIAIDRTPRELAEVGLTATCVIIPELQPMSLLPLAQYRAHPRLYAAPTAWGYPSRTEQELNPWPQPFA